MDAVHIERHQRFGNGPVRTELLLHEVRSRLVVAIGDGHAARVVDEHAEKVLLRHRGAQDERRPEQTEEQQRKQTEADDHEHGAFARLTVAFDPAVRNEARRRERGDGHQDQDAGPRRREGEVSLPEDERRVLEQSAKQPTHLGPLDGILSGAARAQA